jgi:hypothetical protein
MRHKPTNPTRSTIRPSDSGTEHRRAGIRALDCGHDDRDDEASRTTTRADEAQLAPPPVREGANSFGEQRQSL